MRYDISSNILRKKNLLQFEIERNLIQLRGSFSYQLYYNKFNAEYIISKK